MLFDLKKTILKTMIVIVLAVAVLTILLGPKRQSIERGKPLQTSVQIPKEEKVDWLARYEKVDYEVYVSYSQKPLNIELIEALGGYSLIRVADLKKALFDVAWKVEGNYLVLTYSRRTIRFKFFEPIMIGFVVKDGELKYALYRIPYPAVKLYGTYYVPLRTTLRAFGYGVRFLGKEKKIIFGSDVSVDDSNLIFVRYLTKKEVEELAKQ